MSVQLQEHQYLFISSREQHRRGNMSIYKGTEFIAGTPDLSDYAKSSDLISTLSAIYPVGSTYISTTNSCPMASIIPNSTWTQIASNVVVSVNTSVPVKGDGKTLGLSNGSTNHGIIHTPQSGIWASTTAGYGGNVGTAVGGVGHSDILMGVTTDSSKSGIVGTVTRTNLTLYIFKRTA